MFLPVRSSFEMDEPKVMQEGNLLNRVVEHIAYVLKKAADGQESTFSLLVISVLIT